MLFKFLHEMILKEADHNLYALNCPTVFAFILCNLDRQGDSSRTFQRICVVQKLHTNYNDSQKNILGLERILNRIFLFLLREQWI